jgi:glycosyltransferase involved in cell wall biosynthesis
MMFKYKNIRFAIILPAFNEEDTIANVVSDFHNEIPSAEIWVVNNNSSDNTKLFSNQIISKLNIIGGVIDEPRQGKGYAVRAAFLSIDADVYILCDSDMTYPASQIHSLIEPIINKSADMVVGDRISGGQYYSENKRMFHSFGNRLVKFLVNKLFGANLIDIMSGYRVFNQKFVKTYPILVSGFELETDMTIHALDKRMRISEIQVDYRDRPLGSFSKLNTFKDGLRVLNTITKILRYFRPLLFFGLTSIIFLSVGLLAGFPVIAEWLKVRYISHVPLAILSCGLVIVAIVLGAIGLILDAINYQDRRRSESDLLAYKNI